MGFLDNFKGKGKRTATKKDGFLNVRDGNQYAGRYKLSDMDPAAPTWSREIPSPVKVVDRSVEVSSDYDDIQQIMFRNNFNNSLTNFDEKKGIVKAPYERREAFAGIVLRYSSTDEGQIAVLEHALDLANQGKTRDAKWLSDIASDGREMLSRSAKQNNTVWVAKDILEKMPLTSFDLADKLLAKMDEALKTPVQVPPAGYEKGYALPFDAVSAGKALSQVADLVSDSRYVDSVNSHGEPKLNDIYSEELRKEAKTYTVTTHLQANPADANYADNHYLDFARKVKQTHSESPWIVKDRIEKALSVAKSVKINKDREGIRN
jgi:hypothetical protein